MTNHRPIKRFGQHFLTDRRVLERLVEAIAPASDDNMVEIGPGQGALTHLLLERVEHVHAVEIDRNLARALGESESPRRLTVHCADALRFDFASLGEKLRVVGNLPYYISTEILFRLAEIATIKDVHVMLQKEVVDRITASPSSKNYGRLSVTLQRRFYARPLFDVPASAFRPMPKVISAVVALVPRPHTPSVDERTFNAIVSAAFSQRRKKLANSLRQYLSESELQSLAIDPALRAENLTGDDFVRVARFVGERA